MDYQEFEDLFVEQFNFWHQDEAPDPSRRPGFLDVLLTTEDLDDIYSRNLNQNTY